MSTTVPTTPQGNVPAINVPASQDYARLVFAAPYFDTIPIAEILEPSVLEACESLLPGLVPPYVSDAAQQAVQDLAVLLAGSTMSGPLFLNGLPTQPTQAADKQYVDMMVATSGVPEVPIVPTGQVWGRTTGQWVPIASAEGTFLPLSGGTMGGIINMGGNAINNLPAVPNLPNGAAPAQWVLSQIAASSLYQGTWDVDTYQPDLTQPQYHQNNFSWIAITTTSGVVVSPPIPGLQGMTIYNGDTIIYSAQAGGVFQAIHAGGLSLSEADARYLQLAGGQMGGALLLFEDPVQNMEAATRQWVLAQVAAGGIPEAPTDGQIYGRNGNIRDWMPVVGLGGATLTGPLSLAGNAATAMQAVPLQQLQSSLGSYVPLIGNVTITGPITMTGVSSNLVLNSNASANLQAVPLQQLTSTLGSYLTATAAASTYLALAGGTMTGALQGIDHYLSGTLRFNVSNALNYIANGAASALTWGATAGLIMYAAPAGTAGAAASMTQMVNVGTTGIVLGSTGTNTLTVNGTETISNGLTVSGSQTNGTVGSYTIAANGIIRTINGAIVAYGTNPGICSWNAGVGASGIFTGTSSYMYFATMDSTGEFIGTRASIDGSGNMYVNGTLTQGSDASNKVDMIPLEQGVSLIRQLIPKSFAYTSSPAKTQWGFIAQDVETVVPVAVIASQMPDGSAGSLSLDTTALLAAAVMTLKQLDQRCVALEAAAGITPPAEELM